MPTYEPEPCLSCAIVASCGKLTWGKWNRRRSKRGYQLAALPTRDRRIRSVLIAKRSDHTAAQIVSARKKMLLCDPPHTPFASHVSLTQFAEATAAEMR